MAIKRVVEFLMIQTILKALREAGVTSVQQQEVLLIIMSQEGSQQYDISKFMAINPATTSKAIRLLRDKGFVNILPRGRGTSCMLTAEGWKLKTKIWREMKSDFL